jgi:ABC-type transport system substrate-binding protein
MEVAETLPDSPERYKLYDETDELGISKAIYVPLYQTASLLATRNNVKNFIWDLRLGIRFDAIEKD